MTRSYQKMDQYQSTCFI